jgi:tetratricopeptide (TPR) repeat protein
MPPPVLRLARAVPALVAILVVIVWACRSGGEAPQPGAGGSEKAGGTAPTGETARTGFSLLHQGDLKGAEPYLVSALKGAPRDRRILEALGTIYARTDRWKMAEESFQSALAAEPASIGARLGLAAIYVDTGRYDEAVAALNDVRRKDPENFVARVKGALLDVRLGRVAEAEAGARAAISRNSDSAEAHYVLGLALEQKGALDEAAAEMRRVHDLSPAHLGALSHLVTIETRLRHGAEAARWRAAQQEALSRAHVEERVRDHRIQGVAAFNREDYTTALQEFQMIAREDPGDAQVHLHLGSTYIALGKLAEATSELERCLSLDPRNDRALVELGRAQALDNRLEEAIATLQKAVDVNPQFPEPHYYLAGIYRARGDEERYRQEMKTFGDLQSRSQGSALEVQPEARP